MSGEWTIGIIGGSGIYEIDSLEDAQWIDVASPWGKPSDAVLCGRIGPIRVRFLPRHGRGHRVAPDDIDARANIDALKRSGCTDILAIGAVGSLSDDFPPGMAVIPDQFIDHTRGRPSSFFGTGLVGHVSMADPVCPRLSQMAATAIGHAGGKASVGGTYIAIEGPQFSTRAESRMYRQWGADIIGMTAMPEAKLAREAELPYALIGFVTDYDAWKTDTPPVSVDTVIAQLQKNTSVARKAIEKFVNALPEFREESPIDYALEDVVITAPEQHDAERRTKLDAVARRLLSGV